MTPSVIERLRAFAHDYLAVRVKDRATADVMRRAYRVRQEVCHRHIDALPRTVEFAPLRGLIAKVRALEWEAPYTL